MISVPLFLVTWASGRIDCLRCNVIIHISEIQLELKRNDFRNSFGGTDGNEGSQNSKFLADQGALRWPADSVAMSSTERNQPTSTIPVCLSATLRLSRFSSCDGTDTRNIKKLHCSADFAKEVLASSPS